MASFRLITVGIGQFAISNRPDEKLITYALGSCLGIVAWDGVSKTAGLWHPKLPRKQHPHFQRPDTEYVVDGMALFLEQLQISGAQIQRLQWVVAGGANRLEIDKFKIGQRNAEEFLSIARQLCLNVFAQQLAGSQPRNVSIIPSLGVCGLRQGDNSTQFFKIPDPVCPSLGHHPTFEALPDADLA